MLPGQRLILIDTANATLQDTAPLTAHSTNRRPLATRAVALLSAIVVLLCWYVGRPAITATRNAWPPIRPVEWAPGEALAWLRIGAMFLLFSFGTIAAILATRG
jgi:hypothetical protein